VGIVTETVTVQKGNREGGTKPTDTMVRPTGVEPVTPRSVDSKTGNATT